MSSCCDGTGWTTFIGDFEMRRHEGESRTKRKDVVQARRCPRYVEYFKATPLMRDYPEKTPVVNDAECSAAKRAHRDLFERSERKRKDSRDL